VEGKEQIKTLKETPIKSIMKQENKNFCPSNRKRYLLEFVYSEYKYEINRKYLIENKASGYYTILGISFAAFIASLLYIFSNDFNFEQTINGYINGICLMTIIAYVCFLMITVILLNKSFSPKDTLHHDIKDYWEKLQDKSDLLVYDSLYVSLIGCFDFNRKENNKIVEDLKLVDFFIIHLIIFNLLLTLKIIFGKILPNI